MSIFLRENVIVKYFFTFMILSKASSLEMSILASSTASLTLAAMCWNILTLS